MGRGLRFLFGEGLGPHLTKVAWAEAYLRTKWRFGPCSRLAAIDMDRKLEAPPLFGERAGCASDTKSPGLRPTSVPSGILIRPTVWPQCTNVADRQDILDNGPIA